MRNFIQRGDSLTFTSADAVAAGQGVKMGALFGIAATDAAPGEAFEASIVGVFELPKAAGVIAAGAKVYWKSETSNVTTTATGNTLIGATTVAAADGATTTEVRLNGAV
jgi:predicted RecA/RadA family phage recombinase